MEALARSRVSTVAAASESVGSSSSALYLSTYVHVTRRNDLGAAGTAPVAMKADSDCGKLYSATLRAHYTQIGNMIDTARALLIKLLALTACTS